MVGCGGDGDSIKSLEERIVRLEAEKRELAKESEVQSPVDQPKASQVLKEPDLCDSSTLSEIGKVAAAWERLSAAEGIVFLSGIDTPYTGWAKEVYENDQLNTLARFDNGLLKRIKGWFWDGKPQFDIGFIGMKVPDQLTLLTKERHRSPFKPGLTLDYQVGEKYSVSGFALGKMHGAYTVWHADGVTKGMEGLHVDGEQVGLWTNRHKNGHIRMELRFKRGKLDGKMRRFYTDGGKRWEIEFKNGVKEGVESKWHENGVKVSEYHYRGELLMFAKGWKPNGEIGRTSVVDGDGIITTYYSNGDNVFRDWEYSYKNGRRDGPQVRYFPNGKERWSEIWKNGKQVDPEDPSISNFHRNGSNEWYPSSSHDPQTSKSKVKYYELTGLITNLGGPIKSRYINLNLKLGGLAEDFEKIVDVNEHRLRDRALTIIGQYTYEDAQLDGFQERVRVDLKKGFSIVLKKYRIGESDLIRNVYFTQFVIQ